MNMDRTASGFIPHRGERRSGSVESGQNFITSLDPRKSFSNTTNGGFKLRIPTFSIHTNLAPDQYQNHSAPRPRPISKYFYKQAQMAGLAPKISLRQLLRDDIKTDMKGMQRMHYKNLADHYGNGKKRAYRENGKHYAKSIKKRNRDMFSSRRAGTSSTG